MLGRLRSILSLDDLVVGGRFLRSLPHFLRQPLDLDQARAILTDRLARREQYFLTLLQRAVFSQTTNHPYRRLLGLAGCEYGDLAGLVGAAGIEGALATLYQRGVYLSVDELKGRQPVVRGSASLMVDPAQLRNPGAN